MGTWLGISNYTCPGLFVAICRCMLKAWRSCQDYYLLCWSVQEYFLLDMSWAAPRGLEHWQIATNMPGHTIEMVYIGKELDTDQLIPRTQYGQSFRGSSPHLPAPLYQTDQRGIIRCRWEQGTGKGIRGEDGHHLPPRPGSPSEHGLQMVSRSGTWTLPKHECGEMSVRSD